MIAILLLLQLAVATGAAAQCPVLSDIVSAASFTSDALDIASNVANALAAASSGTLANLTCLTACNKACNEGCGKVPTGSSLQPLLNCCAGWFGATDDLASAQAACNSAASQYCLSSLPSNPGFCSNLTSAQSVVTTAASPLASASSLCQNTVAVTSAALPFNACNSICNSQCTQSCTPTSSANVSSSLAPLFNCSASLLSTAANSAAAVDDCATALKILLTCDEERDPKASAEAPPTEGPTEPPPPVEDPPRPVIPKFGLV